MVIAKNIPKQNIFQATCENCGAELEYSEEDIDIGMFGCETIICPVCGEATFVSDRKIKPTFPKTFWGYKENAVNCSNEEIQNFVDYVVKNLTSENSNVGDYSITGSGNTIVIGLKYEDEISIYVCKNYWEETIFPSDYQTIRKQLN